MVAMIRRASLRIVAFVAAYLLAVVTVALALLVQKHEEVTPLRVDRAHATQNTLGIRGISLEGSGLDRGLKVLLMPDTISSDRLLASSIDQQHMFDVVASGDYLFVARASFGLEVFNRHHRPNLAVETSLDLGGRVVALELLDNYLYALLAKPAGLAKISIADPLNPKVVERLELSGRPVALKQHRGSLFVANYYEGLCEISRSLDVVRTQKEFHDIQHGWKLASNGRDLFVAEYKGRLWRLAADNTLTALTPGKDFGQIVRGLEADGDALYVQTEGGLLKSYTLDSRGHLREKQTIFDSPHVHASGVSFQMAGELLISMSSSSGVQLFSKGSNGEMVSRGSILDNGTFTAAAIVEDVLYTTSTRGLDAWSIADLPITHSETDVTVWPGTIYDLKRWKNILIGNGNHSGVQVYGLGKENPFHKVLPYRDIQSVAVSGNHLWVLHGKSSLDVYQLQEDGDLMRCESFESPIEKIQSLHARDNGMLSMVSDEGVYIYSTPEGCSSGLMTFLPVSGKVTDILIEGRTAFVAVLDTKEIIRFDWRSESSPRILSRYTLPEPLKSFSRPRNLVKHGDALYVGMGRVGLVALDISDPSVMEQFFFFDTPGYAGHMHIEDEVLYVSDTMAGIWVFDVSDVDAGGLPIVVGNYRSSMDARDMVFRNGRMYVAGGIKGITVLPVPEILHVQPSDDSHAFVPLRERYSSGRYRLLAYTDAGSLERNVLFDLGQN